MFYFFSANSECLRKLPYCGVPDAVCETKWSKNGIKKSYLCYCKKGFTGEPSNCIGEECICLKGLVVSRHEQIPTVASLIFTTLKWFDVLYFTLYPTIYKVSFKTSVSGDGLLR